MRPFLDIILIVLNLAIWVFIIQAILSWLIAFNVLNMRNQFVAQVWDLLRQVTDPVTRPIRRALPMTRGVDFSPLVAILGIFFLQRVIIYYIYPNVF
ncbi:MAG: YggT family protein [Pseudomonadota bacterium]